jgi:hypothetical protein
LAGKFHHGKSSKKLHGKKKGFIEMNKICDSGAGIYCSAFVRNMLD